VFTDVLPKQISDFRDGCTGRQGRAKDVPAQYDAGAHFDSEGKAILRALARQHLPKTVWNRPKHGFSVSLRELFSNACIVASLSRRTVAEG